eukprot:3222054-Rhodomonas_salina.2
MLALGASCNVASTGRACAPVSKKQFSSYHDSPHASNPDAQVQMKEPAVFAHAAFASQSCAPAAHSSTSTQPNCRITPARMLI